MKKKIAIMLTLILAVSMFLAACSGDDAASAVVGTWKVTNVVDEEFSLSEMEEAFGISFEITMEFDEEGKVKLSALGENEEGTYEVDGDKVTLFFDGEEDTVLEIDGEQMIIQDEEGGSLVMEKQ